ncbi:MAG: hypothetical protein IPM54_43045 [Polyangiaceae bacterium]|nr:hypothetical protein [Polyangiaceae bacterium]
MSRRFVLPLLPEPAAPSVDLVRKRLGGRASTEAGTGDVVTFATDGGIHQTGVVVFVRGDELDVYVSANIVRRIRRSAAKSTDAEAAPSFGRIAESARVFARLTEGQRVCFASEGRDQEGILVEKCRFGALVERPDGKIIGLGFQRVRPAFDAAELPS